MVFSLSLLSQPAEQSSSELRRAGDPASHISFCLLHLPWLHLRAEESEVLDGVKGLRAVRWRQLKVVLVDTSARHSTGS